MIIVPGHAGLKPDGATRTGCFAGCMLTLISHNLLLSTRISGALPKHAIITPKVGPDAAHAGGAW
jgi:hypothetical protein